MVKPVGKAIDTKEPQQKKTALKKTSALKLTAKSKERD